jgi:hypothetical protein
MLLCLQRFGFLVTGARGAWLGSDPSALLSRPAFAACQKFPEEDCIVIISSIVPSGPVNFLCVLRERESARIVARVLHFVLFYVLLVRAPLEHKKSIDRHPQVR